MTEAEQVLTRYLEQTDIILQALRVDEIDVVSRALTERDQLIDRYESLVARRQGKSKPEAETVLFARIQALEASFEEELEAMQLRLLEIFNDNKVQMQRAGKQQQVEQQYRQVTLSLGGNFDIKEE